MQASLCAALACCCCCCCSLSAPPIFIPSASAAPRHACLPLGCFYARASHTQTRRRTHRSLLTLHEAQSAMYSRDFNLEGRGIIFRRCYVFMERSIVMSVCVCVSVCHGWVAIRHISVLSMTSCCYMMGPMAARRYHCGSCSLQRRALARHRAPRLDEPFVQLRDAGCRVCNPVYHRSRLM